MTGLTSVLTGCVMVQTSGYEWAPEQRAPASRQGVKVKFPSGGPSQLGFLFGPGASSSGFR